jgi:hypothetical protein
MRFWVQSLMNVYFNVFGRNVVYKHIHHGEYINIVHHGEMALKNFCQQNLKY